MLKSTAPVDLDQPCDEAAARDEVAPTPGTLHTHLLLTKHAANPPIQETLAEVRRAS